MSEARPMIPADAPMPGEEESLAQRAAQRSIRRGETHRPALPLLSLNMTPMIDCVFLLLTYFILTLDFRPPEDALSADAPAAASGPASAPPTQDAFALPERPVLIVVRSQGDAPDAYTLSADEPALGSLSSAADLESSARAARGVSLPLTQAFTVRPAPDARWEHALAAFNALQRAGFSEITLAKP